MFNTLKYAKMLEEAGFSREQSEISIRMLVEIMEDRLATRDDVKDLTHALVRAESRLTIRMGTMLTAAIAIVATLQKFF